MSVSENSTLLPFARDNESVDQLLDGDGEEGEDLAVNSEAKSPYTDPEIITLNVGSDQSFYVHRTILSQSTVLNGKLWFDKSISLPDLDEITAHTLVHYLYTRKYQVQKSYDSNKEGSIAGYKLSVCVYCAATRYKLDGLAELAKQKVQSFGEDLSVLEILIASRDNTFAGLPDDEVWFNTYLEDAIKNAVSEDPELFTRAGFLDQIVGNRKLLEVVMRAMVNTYSRGPNPVSGRQTGVSTPVPMPSSRTVASIEAVEPETLEMDPIEPFESEKSQPDEVAPTEDVHSGKDNEQSALPDTETTSDSHQALEPYTDELEYNKSKIYQRLDKKNDPAETELTNDDAPLPQRSDSVIGIKEVVSSASAPADEKAVASPEPTETLPAGGKAKGRKGKKKKNAASTATGAAES